MPRTRVRWSITSSSDSRPIRSSATSPVTTFSARSRMDAALARLSPQDGQQLGGGGQHRLGRHRPAQGRPKRPWMVAAALPASCW